MATRLVFPSDEALQLALTGELVPVEVQAGPVRYGRDADGAITVEPERSLTRHQLGALGKSGVRVGRGKGGEGLEAASCWAEMLPLTRLPGDELQTALVLFALPPTARVLELAGELLRLGCDRQELCFLAEGADGVAALLRAVKPPYYTLARALDRPEGMRAFVPSPPGQERVWTELGFWHPLASSVHAPDRGLLLIAAGQWRVVAAGPWTSLYKVLDVELPGSAEVHRPSEIRERLRVSLQLRSRARDAAATLWVLPEGGVEEVDRLVEQLPQRELDRLLFAVADGTVLLRAREGRGAPPVLELPGTAYAPYFDLPNLYLPCDGRLEPPLRRETLRELLAPRPEEITWLTPDSSAGSAFTVARIADDAFAPLEEWVEYVVHAHAEQLEPWVRAAVFDFDAFESIGVEWSERPPAPPPTEPREPKEPRRRQPERAAEVPEVDAGQPEVALEREEAFVEQSAAELLPAVELPPGSSEEQTLAALERAFLESDAPAEAPERTRLWLEMARLNTALRRQRDAGLCWTRALWEAEGEAARRTAQHWSVAEALLLGDSSGGGERLIDELVALDQPTPQQVRALCGQLVRAAGGRPLPPEQLYRLQLWLDENDGGLDLRSLWLGHHALSRMVGSDALQLTRTRDRILARLFRGLSVEQDVPTFLRFCGGGAFGADTTTVTQLVTQLEQLFEVYRTAKRKRSAVEAAASEQLTHGYVELLFAWGLARLGKSDRARELRTHAAELLPQTDPIHAFVVQAYSARIDQALEGLPPETPLPSDLSGQLNQLGHLERFKVDRLRNASAILEPHEHLDPFQAFVEKRSDPRGEEFAPMRGMTDPAELERAVAAVMQKAIDPATSTEDRARLFDGVMDFFPMLPESASVPHIQALVGHVDQIPLPRRCTLLEEALMLAGFFGRGGLVRELVGHLKALIGDLGEEHVAEVARTLAQCLRSTRRVGLQDEAGELLSAAAAAITGAGTPVVLARLQLAAGLADIGLPEEAQAILGEGGRALKDRGLLLVDRLELTRAMAGAASHLPLSQALAELRRLTAQLPQITDSFTTNSHFCLSVIQFIEALILGYASEQLALGELGRRWLDEDEYLVRRRIHRDLEQAQTAEQERS